MNRKGRTQLTLGILLILAGAWFLLDRNVPAVHSLLGRYADFPVNMFFIGGGIFLLGLILGQPWLSVPAAIVAGLGGIFTYQNTIEDPGSWAYLWPLIFGFIGFGTLLQGVLGDDTGFNIRRGLNLMVFGAVLFVVFASFFGGPDLLGNLGPAILLIGVGVWLLGSGIYRAVRGKAG